MTNVLILGAYGLIGSACVRALDQDWCRVVGMGRSEKTANRSHREIDWIIADLTQVSVSDWRTHLKGIDVVINAAGALQYSVRDNLHEIHDTTLRNLCQAAAGAPIRLIQISAAGVSTEASTEFFRSKARGDAHVQSSDLDWVILRPTLVFGPNAYGGTALLRGLAGLPSVTIRAFADSSIQTIGLNEFAYAVVQCVRGKMPMRCTYELSEDECRGLDKTVALLREWLGFSPSRWTIPFPYFVLQCSGRIADGLAWLGWRSPIRTTAIRTLADGVTGSSKAWRDAGGAAFSSFPMTLLGTPSTLQERWFARLFAMLPVAIALLSIFWIVSGAVGIIQFDQAVRIMTDRGFSVPSSQFTVLCGSIADMLLGALILYRPCAKFACLGMVVLSGMYLVGATLFAADLWSDPLGPMVKVLPSIGLATIAYALLEER